MVPGVCNGQRTVFLHDIENSPRDCLRLLRWSIEFYRFHLWFWLLSNIPDCSCKHDEPFPEPKSNSTSRRSLYQLQIQLTQLSTQLQTTVSLNQNRVQLPSFPRIVFQGVQNQFNIPQKRKQQIFHKIAKQGTSVHVELQLKHFLEQISYIFHKHVKKHSAAASNVRSELVRMPVSERERERP